MAAPPEDSPAPDEPMEGRHPPDLEAEDEGFWDLEEDQEAPAAEAGEEEGAYVEDLEEAGPEYEVVNPAATEEAVVYEEEVDSEDEYAAEPAAEDEYTEEEYAAEPAAEDEYTEDEYAAEPAAEDEYTEEEYAAEPAAEVEYEEEVYSEEEYAAEPAGEEEYAAEPAGEEEYAGEAEGGGEEGGLYAAEAETEVSAAPEESYEEYEEHEEHEEYVDEDTGEEEPAQDEEEAPYAAADQEGYHEDEPEEERYTEEDIGEEDYETLPESVKAEPAAPADEAPTPSSGRFEAIALGLGALVVVAGVIIFLAWALKGIGAGGGSSKLKFPVAGERITISAAETYWRKPDREKDRGVRLAARIIPAAAINITDTKGSGALRFFFEDESGSTVGDPITMAVSNGLFSHNSAKQTEVHATHGFADEGDHAAYLTDQIETWHLVVKEGPGPDASGRDFKDIARIPISKQRR